MFNSTATDSDTFFLDPVLHYGRPADTSTRSKLEMRTYDLLDRLHIIYQRLDHPPTASIEACHNVDRILNIEICKNLFLCNAQKNRFYLLMMPGTKKFRTAVLSRQIGSSRLSFAAPEFMQEFLSITPGSVSVLGLMNDTANHVQLLIDRSVIEDHEYFGCHPCINTSSLKIRTCDLLDKFLPFVNHSYTLVDLPREG